MKIKYDYPVNRELLNICYNEYEQEAIDKGNSWRKDCSRDYLFSKLHEEFNEVMYGRHRRFPDSFIQSEIIDLILISGMLYWRLNKQ